MIDKLCSLVEKIVSVVKQRKNSEMGLQRQIQLQEVIKNDKNNNNKKTKGPWWSYIAHLSKQICIFTVEVSAKFTGVLYKFYSTNIPPPLAAPSHPAHVFLTHLDDLNWILKEGHISANYTEIGPVVKSVLYSYKALPLTAIFFDESWQLEQTW